MTHKAINKKCLKIWRVSKCLKNVKLKTTATVSWVKILGLSRNLYRVLIKYCSLVSRTTGIKCCFSPSHFLREDLSWNFMRLSCYRCNDTGVLLSRNDNVLPWNVINFYEAVPVTWSSFTLTDLIYFSKWHSIHILSRPLKHQRFL